MRENSPPRLAIVLILVLLLSACSHKTPVAIYIPSAPPGPTADVQAFDEGLKAFRLATPEGYEQASALFRKAAGLEKSNCEYALHLAESLFFLAQKKQANWELYTAFVTEANHIIAFNDDGLKCDQYPSYMTRLKTLSGMFAGVRTANSVTMILHAIEQDPNDAMNWIVLSQLRNGPAAGLAKAPSERAVELAPDLPIAYYELGKYYLPTHLGGADFVSSAAQDRADMGKKAFEKVLELSPRHDEVVLRIADLLFLFSDGEL